jgi:hypothetical protein
MKKIKKMSCKRQVYVLFILYNSILGLRDNPQKVTVSLFDKHISANQTTSQFFQDLITGE